MATPDTIIAPIGGDISFMRQQDVNVIADVIGSILERGVPKEDIVLILVDVSAYYKNKAAMKVFHSLTSGEIGRLQDPSTTPLQFKELIQGMPPERVTTTLIWNDDIERACVDAEINSLRMFGSKQFDQFAKGAWETVRKEAEMDSAMMSLLMGLLSDLEPKRTKVIVMGGRLAQYLDRRLSPSQGRSAVGCHASPTSQRRVKQQDIASRKDYHELSESEKVELLIRGLRLMIQRVKIANHELAERLLHDSYCSRKLAEMESIFNTVKDRFGAELDEKIAYGMMGVAKSFRHKDTSMSLSLLHEAAAFAPGMSKPYRAIAKVYMEMMEEDRANSDTVSMLRHTELAERHVNIALETEPRIWENWLLKARYLSDTGRLDDAEAAADEITRIASSPEIQSLKREVLCGLVEKEKDPEISKRRAVKALEALDNALSFDSRLSPAYYMKGKVLMLMGRREEAIACIKSALELNPENPRYLEKLAELTATGNQPAANGIGIRTGGVQHETTAEGQSGQKQKLLNTRA